MGDNWRQETAYGCAGLVIVGALLGILLLCLGFAGLAGGIGFVARSLVTMPTATPVAGYTGATLQQLPESRLRYPGATILSSGFGEQPAGLLKGRYAVSQQSVGSQDDPRQIGRWYDQALRAEGWTYAGTIPATAVIAAGYDALWRKGDLLFRLTFYSSTRAAQVAPQYATIVLVELAAQP